MYVVTRRNYNKKRGKRLFSSYDFEPLKNFVYHNFYDISEGIGEEDVDDFIDIERGDRIIATIYSNSRAEFDRVMWYINDEGEKVS